MAHFAKIENNIVTRISVVDNSIITVNGVEYEQLGIIHLRSIHGQDTNWIQTSYNASFRKNYAGIGYTWDQQRDAFIPAKPYSSWILNEDTCRWVAPISYPNDGKMYRWDENIQNWIEINM